MQAVDSYRNQVRPWMCKNLKYLENLATLFPALSFSILDPDVPEKKFARVSVIQMALFHEILRYSVSHPCRSHIWRRLLQTCFGREYLHSLHALLVTSLACITRSVRLDSASSSNS